MFTLTTLSTFLGWSLVINMSILLFSSLVIVAFREFITNLHSKLFGLDTKDVLRAYFGYLGQYKILLLIFNLVPYFALKIMGF